MKKWYYILLYASVRVKSMVFCHFSHQMQAERRKESFVKKAAISIAPPPNGLSLFFTLWNIESAANPIQKTIVVHAWVHLPFSKMLILGRFT